MITTIDATEIKALKVGIGVNLIMALSGWVAYYLSNSEALLLDGNFSFAIAITTFTAVLIARKKHDRTPLFPYGKYFTESFFVLFKGLLILGITIAALFQNIVKIFDYLSGEPILRLESGPILYYSIVMTLLCFGVAAYYQRTNKSINHASPILKVETQSAKIDAYLSLVVGIALILTTMVPENSAWEFLLYIGDAIIVILLSLFLIKMPLQTIREGFIELGGGVLQDKKVRENIERVIQKNTPDSLVISQTYISKMGSSYLIVLYLSSETQMMDPMAIRDFRANILAGLKEQVSNLQVEVVLGD